MTLSLWDVCQRGTTVNTSSWTVNWFDLNHLQVNATKTKKMVINFSRILSSNTAPVEHLGTQHRKSEDVQVPECSFKQ